MKEVLPLLTSRGVSTERSKGRVGTVIRLRKAEAAWCVGRRISAHAGGIRGGIGDGSNSIPTFHT